MVRVFAQLCRHANDSAHDEADYQVMASEGIDTEMDRVKIASEGIHAGMDRVPGFDFIRLLECLQRCVVMPTILSDR